MCSFMNFPPTCPCSFPHLATVAMSPCCSLRSPPPGPSQDLANSSPEKYKQRSAQLSSIWTPDSVKSTVVWELYWLLRQRPGWPPGARKGGGGPVHGSIGAFGKPLTKRWPTV